MSELAKWSFGSPIRSLAVARTFHPCGILTMTFLHWRKQLETALPPLQWGRLFAGLNCEQSDANEPVLCCFQCCPEVEIYSYNEGHSPVNRGPFIFDVVHVSLSAECRSFFRTRRRPFAPLSYGLQVQPVMLQPRLLLLPFRILK